VLEAMAAAKTVQNEMIEEILCHGHLYPAWEGKISLLAASFFNC
jgi:hypothetical protein